MRRFAVRRGWILAAISVVLGACISPPGVGVIPSGEVDVEAWDGEGELQRDTWYYMEKEGTVCANGSSAGLGLNMGADRENLVIYLSGGGACWDVASCTFFKTAANLNVTYSAAQLGAELHPLNEAGLMNRDDDHNPLPRASYAYIPYCTADLHTGRAMTAYDGLTGGELIHHQGARNLEHYLETLPELFPDVRKVWLVGISAGGYGATWNFHRFRRAFPDAELHVFTDASPWLEVEEERWTKWQQSWQLQMPPGCTDCARAPHLLPEFLSKNHEESRFALSVFARDPVLSAYMGVLPGEVESEVHTFIEERFSHPNTKAFVADGSHHEVLLYLNDGVTSSDGETLAEFLSRWIEGQ